MSSPGGQKRRSRPQPRLPRTLAGKRLRFCQEYLVDLNGAAAARRAGYSARTADAIAIELLRVPEIRATIAELQASRAERVGLLADNVLDEVRIVIHSNVRNYRVDPVAGVSLAEGVPEDAWRAVASVKHVRRVTAGGDQVDTVELKLWDKPSAIRLAGQHLGLFEERHRHLVDGESSGVLMVPSPVSAEEWCRAAALSQQGLPGR